MTAAATSNVPSAALQHSQSRAMRLTRVIVLLVVGMFIAFSATQHELLGFDVTVTAISLAAIGAAHAAAWFSSRSRGGSPVALLLAVVAILAAIGVAVSVSTVAFAVAVAAWALASALLEFIGAAVRPEGRQDATLVGAAGILLAILTLFVREDPVAVLGFFGGYAILVGVFLGISAFDSRGAAATPDVSANTDSTS